VTHAIKFFISRMLVCNAAFVTSVDEQSAIVPLALLYQSSKRSLTSASV
jgi:hypothetical protein